VDDSKVFIVGANGQLGTALQAKYPGSQKADIDELDITNRESVMAFDWTGITTIINAAAFTNVDGAESPEGRPISWKVNATAVGYLAEVAREHGMTLVHISSDYVFDGTKDAHTETEDFAPLSVYGASKAAGDLLAATVKQHYIIRTSWVIGEGKNFVLTMKSLAEKDVKPSVVNDQIGRLTFTEDLANCIVHLIDSAPEYGTYNLTNDGEPASWADIAADVYELVGHSRDDVTGVTTEEYYKGKEGIAPRPLQSVLNLGKIKATGFSPRDWKQVLSEYLKNE
jgi:dTDP-4-dehydrorhamnose reductase